LITAGRHVTVSVRLPARFLACLRKQRLWPRGPQCELCVIDEIARMRYQQAVFDTMMLGLRLGDRPRALVATTPRTTPFMKRLVAMDDIRITSDFLGLAVGVPRLRGGKCR
jgi:hypothetical protein